MNYFIFKKINLKMVLVDGEEMESMDTSDSSEYYSGFSEEEE